jgi:Cu(I)/Ag(I) efflux system membrane fusion protein/cobalt-zinc-cadmium efflux system membrane fusion protein
MSAPTPAGEANPHAAHGKAMDAAAEGGPVSIQLSAEEQKSIGVRTSEAKKAELGREIRAVGRVEQPETRLSTISARVGGRIDRLMLDFTGQSVRRGQAIAQIYSPEVVATAEEYRLALETRRRFDDTKAQPTAVQQADELVAASRRRLELWGLTPEQIQGIAAESEAPIHITIHSNSTGIVVERKVTEGQYVREGDVLFTTADLSRVWVLADVYEPDMPAVYVGQPVEITSDALPGVKLPGRVSFIEPQAQAETRTVRVRAEVDNPGLRLRPGMYVNATLRTDGGRVLAVPRSAVLHTGTRTVVYVAKDDGVFEGRVVEAGPPAGENVPILAGLKEGERVVVNGTFMIDSQTRITGGMTGMFAGSKEFAREDGTKPGAPNGKYTITFRTEPDPPKAGENVFRVELTGPDGKPVPDAMVKLQLVMPAMPAMNMPEMRSTFDLEWDGRAYSGRGSISMGGSWNLVVEAQRGGQRLATYRGRVNAR